jgi:hypothetical protein
VIWRETWSPCRVAFSSMVYKVLVFLDKTLASSYIQKDEYIYQECRVITKMSMVDLAGTSLYSCIIIGIRWDFVGNLRA